MTNAVKPAKVASLSLRTVGSGLSRPKTNAAPDARSISNMCSRVRGFLLTSALSLALRSLDPYMDAAVSERNIAVAMSLFVVAWSPI